jgi:hypothetical protein
VGLTYTGLAVLTRVTHLGFALIPFNVIGNKDFGDLIKQKMMCHCPCIDFPIDTFTFQFALVLSHCVFAFITVNSLKSL